MKQVGVVGVSALVLTFGIVSASYAAAPGVPNAPVAKPPAPKPTAATPPPALTVAAPPAPIFYKASVGGADTTPLATQALAMGKCSDNTFQLSASKDASTGRGLAYCSKQDTYLEGIKAKCPAGWGYVITDDKFLPVIKAKFGNTDMCFRNDSATRKKDDPANYKPLNCVIGANGITGGFELNVRDGEDVCQRNAATTALQSPGYPESTVKKVRPTDEQIKALAVSCPPLSYMWVAAENKTDLLTTNVSTKGSIFCRKN